MSQLRRRGTVYLYDDVIHTTPPVSIDWNAVSINRRRYSYALPGVPQPPVTGGQDETRTQVAGLESDGAVCRVGDDDGYRSGEEGGICDDQDDSEMSDSQSVGSGRSAVVPSRRVQPISGGVGALHNPVSWVREREGGLESVHNSARQSSPDDAVRATGCPSEMLQLSNIPNESASVPFINFDRHGKQKEAIRRPQGPCYHPYAPSGLTQDPDSDDDFVRGDPTPFLAPSSSSSSSAAPSSTLSTSISVLPPRILSATSSLSSITSSSPSSPALPSLVLNEGPAGSRETAESPSSSSMATRPIISGPSPSSTRLDRQVDVAVEDGVAAVFFATEGDIQAETDWEAHRLSKDHRNGAAGQTVWYMTSGPFCLVVPPPSLAADPDDIFIHINNQNSRYRTWVMNMVGQWVSVRAGDQQPSDPTRRLSLGKHNKEPSWVKKSSWSVYRSRRKKQRRDPQDGQSLTYTSSLPVIEAVAAAPR
ncbi:hypothetical protein GSI_03107 [Ganoderma sinense ZZ0214-1]|uniref:Uncharacterized protein n=1 Tax=Ganoderma sinense ZZ0214-1 TaxID=1077348 RepID=A0A2G8SKQ0_9APHY|nr:hypothetical protein GSI_03107 [Ganoderma sinense ZZ0214-1]